MPANAGEPDVGRKSPPLAYCRPPTSFGLDLPVRWEYPPTGSGTEHYLRDAISHHLLLVEMRRRLKHMRPRTLTNFWGVDSADKTADTHMRRIVGGSHRMPVRDAMHVLMAVDADVWSSEWQAQTVAAIAKGLKQAAEEREKANRDQPLWD